MLWLVSPFSLVYTALLVLWLVSQSRTKFVVHVWLHSRKEASTIQYGYRTCGTHARVSMESKEPKGRGQLLVPSRTYAPRPDISLVNNLSSTENETETQNAETQLVIVLFGSVTAYTGASTWRAHHNANRPKAVS